MNTHHARPPLQPLSIFAAVASMLCLFYSARAQEDKRAGQDPAELVQGVVARSEALFSGRIEYQALGDFSPNKGLVKLKDETFYFSGSSWSVFAAGSDTPYETCYRGKYIKLSTTAHPDGRLSHVARVRVEQPINKMGPELPVFAGSFWERDQRDYVRDHAREAKDKGQAEMNGVSTRILEWSVPEKDKYKAFHAVGDITDRGGTLRIYVAPQLGFVLPRIEILGLAGIVANRYDAFDFFEAVPGIFLPKRCQWLVYDREGDCITSITELKKVERINEPIPEDVFKMYLPLGTRVADDRSSVKGTQVFDIQAEGDLLGRELDDIAQVGSKLPFWRRRGIAITVGVAIGLLVVLAILFYSRRRGKGTGQTH